MEILFIAPFLLVYYLLVLKDANRLRNQGAPISPVKVAFVFTFLAPTFVFFTRFYLSIVNVIPGISLISYLLFPISVFIPILFYLIFRHYKKQYIKPEGVSAEEVQANKKVLLAVVAGIAAILVGPLLTIFLVFAIGTGGVRPDLTLAILYGATALVIFGNAPKTASRRTKIIIWTGVFILLPFIGTGFSSFAAKRIPGPTNQSYVESLCDQISFDITEVRCTLLPDGMESGTLELAEGSVLRFEAKKNPQNDIRLFTFYDTQDQIVDRVLNRYGGVVELFTEGGEVSIEKFNVYESGTTAHRNVSIQVFTDPLTTPSDEIPNEKLDAGESRWLLPYSIGFSDRAKFNRIKKIDIYPHIKLENPSAPSLKVAPTFHRCLDKKITKPLSCTELEL
jgi:hypothetical protein